MPNQGTVGRSLEFVGCVACGHSDGRICGISTKILYSKDDSTPDTPVFPHLLQLRTVLVRGPYADIVDPWLTIRASVLVHIQLKYYFTHLRFRTTIGD